jgi:hypothetical protein
VSINRRLLYISLQLQDSSSQLDANLCVMLAEAAAKAAEHAALLHVLQPPPSLSDEHGPADEEQAVSVWSLRAADTPGFVPLLAARCKAGKPRFINPVAGTLLALRNQVHPAYAAHKQRISAQVAACCRQHVLLCHLMHNCIPPCLSSVECNSMSPLLRRVPCSAT